ncbi:MAG: fused MFS/spermidine synthase [Bacteroidetes bacterium]|nr:fused MFS/spermidine synthase [Bacteroidota bacterium]
MKNLFTRSVPKGGKVLKSKINGQLELNWHEGKLMLDSESANYSYGALQRALAEGLLHIGKDEVQNFQNILLLGMGAGSVIETLRKDFKNEGKITAVEIDPVVVSIAKKYFKVDAFSKLDIVVMDAFAFVQENQSLYDFTIVDLFIDRETPQKFSSPEFLEALVKLMSTQGIVLFNTVNVEEEFTERNLNMIALFEKYCSVEVLKGIEGGNDLIIIKK